MTATLTARITREWVDGETETLTIRNPWNGYTADQIRRHFRNLGWPKDLTRTVNKGEWVETTRLEITAQEILL